jgi:hypothetical protein
MRSWTAPRGTLMIRPGGTGRERRIPPGHVSSISSPLSKRKTLLEQPQSCGNTSVPRGDRTSHASYVGDATTRRAVRLSESATGCVGHETAAGAREATSRARGRDFSTAVPRPEAAASWSRPAVELGSRPSPLIRAHYSIKSMEQLSNADWGRLAPSRAVLIGTVQLNRKDRGHSCASP